MSVIKTRELEGLSVHLDRLIYESNVENLPPETPHAFIYYLTINNLTDRIITFLGRKWVIKSNDGEILVVEGEKIVGQTPTLESGEAFSYNSYHIVSCNSKAKGAFYGIDEFKNPVHVNIPTFDMIVPESQY